MELHFNGNDRITCTLTENGKQILRAAGEKVPALGRYTTSVWNFMYLFGDRMHLGNSILPFKIDEMILHSHGTDARRM